MLGGEGQQQERDPQGGAGALHEELFDPRLLYKVKDNHRNKAHVSKSLALPSKAVQGTVPQGSGSGITAGLASNATLG